jgi:type IV secretory pathway protease TraF
VAVEGDGVSIDEYGVTVNGQQLDNSVPLLSDLAGRPMPVCRLQGYRLRRGEVLLMSDYSPISFDGRYFGPIRLLKKGFLYTLSPIYTGPLTETPLCRT